MKKILDILTGVAAVVFIYSLCAIESLKPSVLMALMISGGWLVAYAMIWNELRRMEGR